MKKLQFSKSADSNILKSKGFYIALGLCLLAVGVTIYLGVNATVNDLNQDKTLDLPDTSAIGQVDDDLLEPDTEEVNNTQNDVPQENTASAEEPKPAEEQKPAQPQSFAMPLEGKALNGYSGGELVKSKTLKEWRTHDGIDIQAAAGTPVKAVCDGVVEEIKEDPMWGVCVIISHSNNYQSCYYGLKANVPVKKGASVKVGDMIGHVGNTAEIEIAEESHLHFAMKLDGAWIDPASVIK